FGDVILYTGAGGRDPVSRRQTADQTLNGPNLSLATSGRLGLPVRVVRLIQGRAERFFRYDGLYRVANYFPAAGEDGFRVWRFRLERLAPVAYDAHGASGRVGEPAPRVEVTVSRVVRDTAVTREVKRLHGYRCQMCGDRVETPSGPYAEAAHIQPLGRPHDGPDTLANVLCLCPTHHAAFDLYGVGIADDGSLIGLPGRLQTAKGHTVGADVLRYRRGLFDAAQAEAVRQAA
ncbi:MAG TPA: YDG/SRA domain-containing protein, partial [Rubricoccaceae bacterium]